MKHEFARHFGIFCAALHVAGRPRVGHAAPYLHTYITITITWRSRAIPIRGEAGTRVHGVIDLRAFDLVDIPSRIIRLDLRDPTIYPS